MTTTVDEEVKKVFADVRDWQTRHGPREEANSSEGIKALLAINAGGAIAMLGFMQALVAKPTASVFAGFKYYGANALLCFALGVFVAALVPAARFIYFNRLLVASKSAEAWEKASFVLWALSLALFLLGISCAGRGIHIALI
jgi:hypothetical protein